MEEHTAELREPLHIDAASMTEIECIDRCTNTINEAQCIDAATMTSLDFEEKKKMTEVERELLRKMRSLTEQAYLDKSARQARNQRT